MHKYKILYTAGSPGRISNSAIYETLSPAASAHRLADFMKRLGGFYLGQVFVPFHNILAIEEISRD